MASFKGTIVYCTPTQAKKISTYPNYTSKATINRTQALQIRDYYNNKQMRTSAAVSAITSIVFGAVNAFGVILGPVAGFAASVTQDLCNNKAKIFEGLATNTKGRESWTLHIKYKYTRHGSNDGAWYLQDIYIV